MYRKEKISFPTFEIADVINQEWEESEVFRYLSEQRFLLQIFVEEEKGYLQRNKKINSFISTILAIFATNIRTKEH